MDQRNVLARVSCQQGECCSAVVHRTPEAGEAEPVLAGLGEFPFRLRRLCAGEVVEKRGGHQTATDRKAATLRAEIDDRRSFWSSRWEAPPEFSELVRPVFESPDHGGLIGRPDIFAWFEVWGCVRPCHGDAGLTKRREVVAIGDVVAVIVAHTGFPRAATVSI
jgi:hypothetical protein